MGRIIVVGDRFQSIYGFRGADITAMDNLQKMLESRENGCKLFPLSVCRRCPKSHLKLAQALVPDIKWCVKESDGIDAPEGEIYQVAIDTAIEMMREGDMGVSRVNRVLVPVAYACIKAKKKVVIRGREVGQGLIAFIKKLKPTDVADLLYKIEKHEADEMQKLLDSEGLAQGSLNVMKRLSRKNQQKLENLLDKTGCIRALCDGVNDLSELLANINSIFAEFDDNGKPKDAIILGTVHRTKGLEAHNVFMIDPANFPHQMASKAWEVEQERNLTYVAVTRAKFQLDKQGNVIEPGRLIFVGSCPSIFKAEWLSGLSKYPADEKQEETPVVSAEALSVIPSEVEMMRHRLISFYISHHTPAEAAKSMVNGLDEKTLRQCVMIMLG